MRKKTLIKIIRQEIGALFKEFVEENIVSSMRIPSKKDINFPKQTVWKCKDETYILMDVVAHWVRAEELESKSFKEEKKE